MKKSLNSIISRLEDLREIGPVAFYCRHIKNSGSLVHVGAHLAEELDFYSDLGFRKIFWVEANPAVFSLLKKRVGEKNCAQALVHRENGVVFPFRISNNSVSSSIFDFSADIPWNQLKMVDEIELVSRTLDSLLLENSELASIYAGALLVLDIQGAELPALEGGREFLKGISGIVVEISKKSTYLGGTDFQSLNKFLRSHGFKKIGEWVDFRNGHGDALYISDEISVNFSTRVLGVMTSLANVADFLLRSFIRRGWINPG